MKTTEKNIPYSSEIGIPLLPEPYKSAAKLRIIDKLPYKEIAERINITDGQCRVCVYRAKKKLNKLDKMLEDYSGDEEKLKEIIKKWYAINIE